MSNLWKSDGDLNQYGEIYLDNNTTEFVINTAGAWHSSINFIEGITNGFEYSTSISKAITAFADATSGNVTVTAGSHGLSKGQSITITGTTNYNGVYVVGDTTTDTFIIIATWVANDATGSFTKGNNLVLTGPSGYYKITYSFSIKALLKDVLLSFAAIVNADVQSPTIASNFFDNVSDVFGVSGHGFSQLITGDHVTFGVKNETSATNILARYGALSIVKIG